MERISRHAPCFLGSTSLDIDIGLVHGGTVLNPYRLLLADDNPELLQTMKRFLDACPEVDVVGQGHSGAEALELQARLKPDLVLLDCVMPGMDGLEVTRRWKTHPGGPLVVILTLYDDEEHRLAARAAGADAFLAKERFATQAIPLIRDMLSE